ncbi:MAG: DoxX family protein [Actinomycetota bacterium]|nr:DoxX family protein [Actinomycetota bacterium]
MARLWLGWEWLQAGWSKVFGGNITWRFWNWGDSAYSLTGDGNIGWVRSGTVPTEEGGQRTLQVGDAVAGFARGALERGTAGEHPDIAYSWYVAWLERLRDTGHSFFGPLVAVGEVVIGICLILGLVVGVMAFLGAILNFSFLFAGSAGVNPAMILVSGLLVQAWRNAGWYGLDRFVLPKLGTPGTAASCSPRERRTRGPADDQVASGRVV